MQLPFESLGPFKTALKQYFSDESWSAQDADRLSDLVAPHIAEGAWEVQLDDDLTLRHRMSGGRYELEAEGAVTAGESLWDRVFEGPIRPEPTPHPRKVKFGYGGEPAPGVWFLHDDEVSDDRVRRLLDEPGVTDVMVAGDFVTIGLDRNQRWEDRLDGLIALVGSLFDVGATHGDDRSRDELITEGQSVHIDSDQLHLLDPDDETHRTRLLGALEDDDARTRRIAVAVLAGASDPEVAGTAVSAGYGDGSLIVRRMAVDAAGDAEDELHRDTLERALGDPDAWTRWRAVRALSDLGLAASRDAVQGRSEDPDFQVRFEVARVLRDD